MNIVIMVGRLTKDPEIRYSQQGKAVCNFSIAVDRRIKREGENNTDFFNCVCFGKTAEFVEKYLKKGTQVIVEGSYESGSYTNKDGNKVYTSSFRVRDVRFS